MIKDCITSGRLFHGPHRAMAFVCLDRCIHVRSLIFSLPHKQRLIHIRVIDNNNRRVPSYPASFVAPSAVPKDV
jgi:hypothetical protein